MRSCAARRRAWWSPDGGFSLSLFVLCPRRRLMFDAGNSLSAGQSSSGTVVPADGVPDGKANLSDTHSRRVGKMRLIPPVAAQSAWLIAGRSAAGAFLLAVTVSACTGGGGSAVAVDLRAGTADARAASGHPGTRTPSPRGQASRSPGSSPSATSTNRGSVASARRPRPTRFGSVLVPRVGLGDAEAYPQWRDVPLRRRTRPLRRRTRRSGDALVGPVTPRSPPPHRRPAAAARQACRTGCCSGSAAGRS